MVRTSVMWALALAGCEPVDWYLPLPSDAPDHPLSEPRLVPAHTTTSRVQRCGDPFDRERSGPFRPPKVDQGPKASSAFLQASGAMVGDLDRDGKLDLVAPFEPYASFFRGWDGGLRKFEDILAPFDLQNGTGGSMADLEGDGDLDLLILRYNRPAVLLRNEGLAEDGRPILVDVTPGSGLDADGPSTSSAWGDIDADGDLDLFIGAYGDPASQIPARSRLFENRGNGSFLDRSHELAEVLGDGFTRVGGFHDVDDDGLPELYVVNDVVSVVTNVLLRNVGGRFVRDGNASGLDLELSGGGLGVGDVNGDRVPDFLIPSWDDISLMLSNGAGAWVDHALSRGMLPDAQRGQTVGWGAELADMDNDGDLDGVVAYGALDIEDWANPDEQPDALFLQQDDGTFVDVAPEWGVDDLGKNRGFVVADFNDDGWLDLVTRDVDGPSTLYASRCGASHWLKVIVRDVRSPNRHGIGARVTVVGESGESWTRWVNAGGTGYGTGGPPELHFGLGAEEHLERVEVRWPDGEESWVAFGEDADQILLVDRDR